MHLLTNAEVIRLFLPVAIGVNGSPGSSRHYPRATGTGRSKRPELGKGVIHRPSVVALIFLVRARDRRDGAYDLRRLQRRLAAHRIPCEQQLGSDFGIDAV